MSNKMELALASLPLFVRRERRADGIIEADFGAPVETAAARWGKGWRVREGERRARMTRVVSVTE